MKKKKKTSFPTNLSRSFAGVDQVEQEVVLGGYQVELVGRNVLAVDHEVVELLRLACHEQGRERRGGGGRERVKERERERERESARGREREREREREILYCQRKRKIAVNTHTA